MNNIHVSLALSTFGDDISGKELHADLVQKARKEELEYIDKKPLYEEVSVEECFRVTGRPTTDTKWVDVNKGDTERMEMGSR